MTELGLTRRDQRPTWPPPPADTSTSASSPPAATVTPPSLGAAPSAPSASPAVAGAESVSTWTSASRIFNNRLSQAAAYLRSSRDELGSIRKLITSPDARTSVVNKNINKFKAQSVAIALEELKPKAGKSRNWFDMTSRGRNVTVLSQSSVSSEDAFDIDISFDARRSGQADVSTNDRITAEFQRAKNIAYVIDTKDLESSRTTLFGWNKQANVGGRADNQVRMLAKNQWIMRAPVFENGTFSKTLNLKRVVKEATKGVIKTSGFYNGGRPHPLNNYVEDYINLPMVGAPSGWNPEESYVVGWTDFGSRDRFNAQSRSGQTSNTSVWNRNNAYSVSPARPDPSLASSRSSPSWAALATSVVTASVTSDNSLALTNYKLLWDNQFV